MDFNDSQKKVLYLTQLKNQKLIFTIFGLILLLLLVMYFSYNRLLNAIPIGLLTLLFIHLFLFAPQQIIFNATGMKLIPDYFHRNEFTWDEIEKIEKNKTAVGPYLNIHLKNGAIRKIGLFVTPYKDRKFTLTEFAALAEEMGVKIGGITTGS